MDPGQHPPETLAPARGNLPLLEAVAKEAGAPRRVAGGCDGKEEVDVQGFGQEGPKFESPEDSKDPVGLPGNEGRVDASVC